MPGYRLNANARSSMVIVKADFNAIEKFIRDNKDSKRKAQIGLALLVRTMATVVKGFAQGYGMGPVAPRRRSVPALAHRIPVQRITGAYVSGWRVQSTGPARFLVFNDAKEAYLIEYGIYQRVRRPILKMSMIAMLRFLENSRTEQRFLDSLIKPRRNAAGRYASIPFNQRLSGTGTLGGMAGPTGELP